MSIVMVLLVAILTALSQVSTTWQRMSDKVDSFQSARLAFDLLSKNLSRATLNTYLDYDNPQKPTRYQRVSELAFLSTHAGADGIPGTPNTGQAVFFQLPAGHTSEHEKFGKLKSLLNTCGYYVAFGDNQGVPAHVSQSANPWRFRLMQLLAPTEDNTIYDSSLASTDWVKQLTTAALPIADNVIALVVRAQDPAAVPVDVTTDYTYDTRLRAKDSPQPATANQLPPALAVTMIVLDEKSARRIEAGSTPPAVITDNLRGKFTEQSDEHFQQDLSDVEKALSAAHLAYRVYNTSISLKESKWSP
jgi:uncharacterized protein (TIGR02599 family)